MKRFFLLSLLLVACASVWADGVLQSVAGSVVVNAKPARVGDTVPSGATVQTGATSRARIQFDDGHVVALGSTTQFKVREYAYSKTNAAKDNIVFDLILGTLRSISGALGARNPGKFSLVTPTATVGIRGTDFVAGVSNAVSPTGAVSPQTMFSVTSGNISVTTPLGQVVLGAGQSVLTSTSGLITTVATPTLPAEMQSLSGSQAGAAGAGSATGAAAGGVGIPGVAAAVVIGVAAAVAADGATTGTTGTTGTGQ